MDAEKAVNYYKDRLSNCREGNRLVTHNDRTYYFCDPQCDLESEDFNKFLNADRVTSALNQKQL